MARTVNFKSHRNHLLLFLTRKEGKQDNLQHTRHTVVASIARSSWCCQILLFISKSSTKALMSNVTIIITIKYDQCQSLWNSMNYLTFFVVVFHKGN